jgi:glutaminyl-tRNA synthetase
VSTPERPSSPTPSPSSPSSASNFIREKIQADVAAGRWGGRVQTRFPPEPNGYLHIGHAKAICIDFGMAAEFGGKCNLRFDDTNPTGEDIEYVEAIRRDIEWLGFHWDAEFFASDYFERMYECAIDLIRNGKAYVDSQTLEQIREGRGNFYKPGVDSPHRERSVEENLDLFARMRAGEFEEGAHVLRAKIDMAHTNLNMRDPPIYRILKKPHHRTGDAWPIYPMYDYAHPLEDAFENITHSLCSLEFQDHRPLYDWVVDNCPVGDAKPEQTEFARLNLDYTLMSKRKLLQLVNEKHVDGWDDPRMPTLSGMRRRGIPPEAIVRFCERVGVSKRDGIVDITMFEHEVREHLNEVAARYMGVLDPLELVIENYPEGEVEFFDARLHPEDDRYGSRKLPFGRVLYIERDDFRMQAPKKWYRLAPGSEVRLRYAGLVTCKEAVTNAAGEVTQLRCVWDPESRGGKSPDGRKVKGTIHWVSATHALDAEVRLYDRLFTQSDPEANDADFRASLNPDSRQIVKCKLEPALADVGVGIGFQLERLGYFCLDPDSKRDALLLNRTIGLRDSWAKIEKQLAGG